MSSIGLKRFESTLKKEVSIILASSTNDYLNSMIVTDIDLTTNKEYCKVYFMTTRNKEKTISELKRSMRYINKMLSDKMEFRRLPRLAFHYDTTMDKANSIEEKLKDLYK